jgi:nucleotide-binding universal stress UspA family protein
MQPTIVVPIDTVAGSDAAVPVAGAIARQSGGRVVLLTVVSPEADTFEPMSRLADLADWHGVDAHCRVQPAVDIGDAILSECGGPNTLICMETRARGALGEMAIGSVSERVLRESSGPVLLVGPHCAPAPERFETMVVGLDGSVLAESILPLVADWSAHLDVLPWLFQVLPSALLFGNGDDDIQDSCYVQRLAHQLARAGRPVEWDVCRDRHPAAAIARYASDRPGALIALTTHGRSGVSRMALGSVALDVAGRATVPVLVAHASRPTVNRWAPARSDACPARTAPVRG